MRLHHGPVPPLRINGAQAFLKGLGNYLLPVVDSLLLSADPRWLPAHCINVLGGPLTVVPEYSMYNLNVATPDIRKNSATGTLKSALALYDQSVWFKFSSERGKFEFFPSENFPV